MVAPQKVSCEESKRFSGVRWNAMNDICALSDLQHLTPIQRAAHLAYWYMSEVYNGGHDQYFGNQSHFDHHEVVNALNTIGASEHATILASALEEESRCEDSQSSTTSNDDACPEAAYPLIEFDKAFNECKTRIEDYLEDYLDRHEAEFIEWIP